MNQVDINNVEVFLAKEKIFKAVKPDLYWNTEVDVPPKRELAPALEYIEDKFKKIHTVIRNLPGDEIEAIASYSNNLIIAMTDAQRLNREELLGNLQRIQQTFDGQKDLLSKIWERVSGLYLESIMDTIVPATIAEIQNQLSEIRETKDQLQTELQTIRDNYKPTVATAESQQQIVGFQNSANGNQLNARWWLGFSAVLAAVFLCCIYLFFGSEILKSETAKPQDDVKFNSIFTINLIRATVLKILALSVIAYNLKLCVENYNAQIHNYLVNTHKANCFDTTSRFVNLQIAKENIDEILNNSSKEIFSQQQTGYLNKKGDLNLSMLERIVSLFSRSEKHA